jgi:hypothetical protein
MKYWNKDKRIRQQHWHRVERGNVMSYNETKRTLQLHPSTGRFYLYYGSNSVWFEHAQDATWFLLRWS